MAIKRYNATLRNLEYRLRLFKDNLPLLLEDIIKSKEDVIVSAIADNQLYRRGITGKGIKIMSYAPYKPTTIQINKITLKGITRGKSNPQNLQTLELDSKITMFTISRT